MLAPLGRHSLGCLSGYFSLSAFSIAADGSLGVRLFAGLEPGDHLALSVDQELVKVPLDLTGEFGVGRLAREELEKRIDPLALDDDLREEREADLVLGRAKLLDLLVGPRFLLAEFVGGEGQDREPLILVLLVNRLEILVLRSQAALAGRVDDQQDLALVAGQVDILAFDVLDVKIKYGRRFLGGVGGRYDRDGGAEEQSGQTGQERQQTQPIDHGKDPSRVRIMGWDETICRVRGDVTTIPRAGSLKTAAKRRFFKLNSP